MDQTGYAKSATIQPSITVNWDRKKAFRSPNATAINQIAAPLSKAALKDGILGAIEINTITDQPPMKQKFRNLPLWSAVRDCISIWLVPASHTPETKATEPIAVK